MNILYGVQATGNGHISRSREVIRNLKSLGHNVQVILSGRDPAQLWDMEIFQPYKALRGLTFHTSQGKVQYLKTARHLNLIRFFRDIIDFSATDVDLVVTDFEPVTARIARWNKIPSIGVGHQYAFNFDIPIAGANPLSRFIIKNYAPVDFPLGLHWHHFDQPILPPIIPQFSSNQNSTIPSKVLVYLAFESLDDILVACQSLENSEFFIYHHLEQPEDRGHIHLRPFSRHGFLDDLTSCETVICNAGFELVSEALHLGKKIIIKPLVGQMEQLSNALAISKLELGNVITKLSAHEFLGQLQNAQPNEVHYPNVAKMVAEWIDQSNWHDTSDLCRLAWDQTAVRNSLNIPL